MNRKLLILAAAILMMLLAAPASLAAEKNTLLRSDYQFTLEYDPMSMPSYLIQDQVYVPLRIFADQFNVTVAYDAGTMSIQLDFGEPQYKKAQLQELTQFVKETDRAVQPTPNRLLVQGKEIDLPMVLIDGYNFIQIDDAAEAFGYRAVADAQSKTISLTQDAFFGSPYLPQFADYLEKTQIPLQAADMANLNDAEFDPYQVYLVGEQHAIAKNFEIQLAWIKYFNQHQNVRYIISEDGFCGTTLLNRYLQTGDSSIIQNAVMGTKGSFAYSKDYYAFYENLYRYNQTLPQDQKLFFVGIDVQHSQELGIDCLLSLFAKEGQMPDSVQSAYTALQARSETSVSTAALQLKEHPSDFESYFGTQFDTFRFGLRSVEQGIQFHENDDFELREQFIHENFRDYYQAFEMKKCFGMFGGAHTLLNGSFGELSNLAAYLNSELELTKGKVCSIMTDYINCSYMDSSTGASHPVLYHHSDSISRLLDQSTENDLTLFPLNRDGSPFQKSGFTDAFQYYLCVKNSPAAIPYGELGTAQQ